LEGGISQALITSSKRNEFEKRNNKKTADKTKFRRRLGLLVNKAHIKTVNTQTIGENKKSKILEKIKNISGEILNTKIE
jgi:hypothetical protein